MCMKRENHGKQNSHNDRSKNCNGRKIVWEKKILEVHTDKGMKDSQKITFHEKGDHKSGLKPDIITMLDQNRLAAFNWRWEDIFIYWNLQLTEAFCGFQEPISVIEQETIILTSNPGQDVNQKNTKCVHNESMAIYSQPHEEGCLIIE